MYLDLALDPVMLAIDHMSNADKFFGNLNSVLEWNRARCKSREFFLKCFERGFDFNWQFVGLHRPKVKQIYDCKTLLKSGVSAGGQGVYCLTEFFVGSIVAHGGAATAFQSSHLSSQRWSTLATLSPSTCAMLRLVLSPNRVERWFNPDLT